MKDEVRKAQLHNNSLSSAHAAKVLNISATVYLHRFPVHMHVHVPVASRLHGMQFVTCPTLVARVNDHTCGAMHWIGWAIHVLYMIL